jgi:DNA polymerase-3 subunit delta'
VTTAAELLLDTASRGELHHSVILHGPARDTLRDLSIGVAKALNCLNGTTGDDCAACARIARGIHPDVHLVEVASERKLISVDQIRDIVTGASMRPYEGRTKVFIVGAADALSESGSNALLKTLEEPTRDTNFLLLTRSPDLLLPTIRSRSQSIYVGGEESVDQELASFITDGLSRFASKQEAAALLAIAAAVAGREDAGSAIALLGTILCDAAAGRSGALADIDRERILAAAGGVTRALQNLVVNADPRLIVEQALSELIC